LALALPFMLFAMFLDGCIHYKIWRMVNTVKVV
jgi:hypothetical protein